MKTYKQSRKLHFKLKKKYNFVLNCYEVFNLTNELF